MSTVRAQGRFHIVFIVKYIRYGLILCLVPMLQALIAFDLPSLTKALRQDAAILVGMALFSFVIWRRCGFLLTHRQLTLRRGILWHRQQVIRPSQLAVIQLDRPIYLRLVGCTRVRLFAASSAAFGQVQFFLPRRQAAVLAECLMPVQSASSFFAPTGAERLRFTMLSANLVTTSLLVVFSARQTQDLIGNNLGVDLGSLAMANLGRLERLAELFLPAGVAWLFTLIFTLWGIALFFSLLATANFRVSRSGGVILAKGGRINLTERRILASAVSYCDIRVTPISRLLRRYPVFLCAGSYTGADLPILVYGKGRDALLQALMPQFIPPRPVAGITANRSWPQFLWKSGAMLAFCGMLCVVSVWKMPQLTPLLLVPLAVCAGLTAASVEGWFTEGVARNSNGTMAVCYTRLFSRHQLCVFTPNLSLAWMQTPFSEAVGRCTLTIHLPCRRRIRVRSIKKLAADHLRLVA
ncbi:MULTISPECIES: PH domain-containing protein [unclassified Allofournierella]|uniref:PH domain-containing protein n=1 Tax=unclassified Allofournierella TaxID=2633662 RepID=UPI0022EB1C09|nr:PH domain-containing protein [Fournierella sp. CML151]